MKGLLIFLVSLSFINMAQADVVGHTKAQITEIESEWEATLLKYYELDFSDINSIGLKRDEFHDKLTDLLTNVDEMSLAATSPDDVRRLMAERKSLMEKIGELRADINIDYTNHYTAHIDKKINVLKESYCNDTAELYWKTECLTDKWDKYRSSPLDFETREFTCSGVANSGNKYELKFKFEYPMGLKETIVPARNVRIEVTRYNSDNTSVNAREIIEHQLMAFNNNSNGGFGLSNLGPLGDSSKDNVNISTIPSVRLKGDNSSEETKTFMNIDLGRIRGVKLSKSPSCDLDPSQFNLQGPRYHVVSDTLKSLAKPMNTDKWTEAPIAIHGSSDVGGGNINSGN